MTTRKQVRAKGRARTKSARQTRARGIAIGQLFDMTPRQIAEMLYEGGTDVLVDELEEDEGLADEELPDENMDEAAGDEDGDDDPYAEPAEDNPVFEPGAWPTHEELRPWPEPRSYEVEYSYTLLILPDSCGHHTCRFEPPPWFADALHDERLNRWAQTVSATFEATAAWLNENAPDFLDRPRISALLQRHRDWKAFERDELPNPIVTQEGFLKQVAHAGKVMQKSPFSKQHPHIWLRWHDRAMPLDALFTREAQCVWLATGCLCFFRDPAYWRRLAGEEPSTRTSKDRQGEGLKTLCKLRKELPQISADDQYEALKRGLDAYALEQNQATNHD